MRLTKLKRNLKIPVSVEILSCAFRLTPNELSTRRSTAPVLIFLCSSCLLCFPVFTNHDFPSTAPISFRLPMDDCSCPAPSAEIGITCIRWRMLLHEAPPPQVGFGIRILHYLCLRFRSDRFGQSNKFGLPLILHYLCPKGRIEKRGNGDVPSPSRSRK